MSSLFCLSECESMATIAKFASIFHIGVDQVIESRFSHPGQKNSCATGEKFCRPRLRRGVPPGQVIESANSCAVTFLHLNFGRPNFFLMVVVLLSGFLTFYNLVNTNVQMSEGKTRIYFFPLVFFRGGAVPSQCVSAYKLSRGCASAGFWPLAVAVSFCRRRCRSGEPSEGTKYALGR